MHQLIRTVTYTFLVKTLSIESCLLLLPELQLFSLKPFEDGYCAPFRSFCNSVLNHNTMIIMQFYTQRIHHNTKIQLWPIADLRRKSCPPVDIFELDGCITSIWNRNCVLPHIKIYVVLLSFDIEHILICGQDIKYPKKVTQMLWNCGHQPSG